MSNPNKSKSQPVSPVAAIINATLNGQKFASYRDLGYGAACVSDAKLALGKAALNEIPGYPDAVPEEIESEIKAGIVVRKAEITPAVYFRKDGHDNYTKLDEVPELDKNKNPTDSAILAVSVAYAETYTTHEFGKLKKEQPNLHRMVKDMRDSVRKYVSNTYNALLAAGRSQDRERGETKLWVEKVKAFMDELPKKAKSALARGDSTAPDAAAISKAVAAFWVELK